MPQDEAYFDIYYDNDDVDIYYIANGNYDRSRAMSIRCIKDWNEPLFTLFLSCFLLDC